MTGVGPGALGTALANYHLGQVLSVVGVHVVTGLEVLVGAAADKFDAESRLVHEPTRETLRKAFAALARLATALASQ